MALFYACLLFVCVVLVTDVSAGISARKHKKRLMGVPPISEPNNLPADQWFLQKLDHFEPTNPKTWWQRYQVNDTWFRGPDSPVFLMIGGEGPATAEWLVAGAWIDYAQKYNALCLQLEHRFYGQSHPTDDLSTDNLRFLSSEQALADLAYFIEGINKNYGLKSTNKWIAFGGSYPGSLAAWLRLKYPHLVHGAVSTSGPLLAQADFKAYDEVVQASLTTYSESCAVNVHHAALDVQDYLKTKEGVDELSKKFKLCSPLDVRNKKDVSNFAEALAGNFQGVVQYNKDNRIGGNKPPTLDDLCAIMMDETVGDVLDRYAAVNNFMLSQGQGQDCIDISYYNFIQEMRRVDYDTSAGGRPWTYQTCTEFGFYQTSSSSSELFGSLFDLKFFVDQCKDIFGDDFDMNRLNQGIERSNIIYGQLGIQVDRVVFVHGSIDPWHALGITKSDNPLSPAIFIQGTAHCANMYPASQDDPPQLTAARVKISKLIGDFLDYH